jgi:hypothetical protein
MYDVWAAYDPVAVGTRLGGSLRRPPAERTDAYKGQAVSVAAYRALLDLFPTRAADFRALLTAMLTWPTFSSARDDAGMSRRYGGIHFPDGDEQGRTLGASVGQNAWDRACSYFDGTAG